MTTREQIQNSLDEIYDKISNQGQADPYRSLVSGLYIPPSLNGMARPTFHSIQIAQWGRPSRRPVL